MISEEQFGPAVARRTGVNWIEVDGDVVVFDPQASTVHVLEGAAAIVWQLLDGEPIIGLDEVIAATFDIDPEHARRDIAASIRLLFDAFLVTTAIN